MTCALIGAIADRLTPSVPSSSWGRAVNRRALRDLVALVRAGDWPHAIPYVREWLELQPFRIWHSGRGYSGTVPIPEDRLRILIAPEGGFGPDRAERVYFQRGDRFVMTDRRYPDAPAIDGEGPHAWVRRPRIVDASIDESVWRVLVGIGEGWTSPSWNSKFNFIEPEMTAAWLLDRLLGSRRPYKRGTIQRIARKRYDGERTTLIREWRSPGRGGRARTRAQDVGGDEDEQKAPDPVHLKAVLEDVSERSATAAELAEAEFDAEDLGAFDEHPFDLGPLGGSPRANALWAFWLPRFREDPSYSATLAAADMYPDSGSRRWGATEAVRDAARRRFNTGVLVAGRMVELPDGVLGALADHLRVRREVARRWLSDRGLYLPQRDDDERLSWPEWDGRLSRALPSIPISWPHVPPSQRAAERSRYRWSAFPDARLAKCLVWRVGERMRHAKMLPRREPMRTPSRNDVEIFCAKRAITRLEYRTWVRDGLPRPTKRVRWKRPVQLLLRSPHPNTHPAEWRPSRLVLYPSASDLIMAGRPAVCALTLHQAHDLVRIRAVRAIGALQRCQNNEAVTLSWLGFPAHSARSLT